MERVDLIFEGLESVEAPFLSESIGESLVIFDSPFLSRRKMFFLAGSDVRSQGFVDTVDRRSPLNVAGDLGNDLGSDRSIRCDRTGRLDLGISDV